MSQSATLQKPERNLITALKIQDRKYKKWRKFRALGISIRKSKVHVMKIKASEFHIPAAEHEEKPDLLKELPDKYISKGYQVVSSSTLEVRRASRVKNQQYPLHERLTHRSRINGKLHERLRVDAPEILVPAKTDIDPGFFSTIEGRPIAKQHKRREYLKRQTELLFTRATILDISEKINGLRSQLDEKEIRYNHAENSLPFHERQFWHSIYKDFDITANVHKRQKETRKKLSIAGQRKEKLQNMLQVVRCNLYNLEEHWRSLKIHQAFLYQISPLPWRKKYDRIHVDEDKLILAPMSTACDQYHFKFIDPAQPIEELIQFFYEVTSKEEPPELFFTDPKQLKDYFDYMVELNANILSQAMKLQEENKELNKFFKILKIMCHKELQTLHNQHKKFLESFSWLEKNKTQLLDLAIKERDNVTTMILSDPHVEVRALIEGAYNVLLNPTRLKVGLITMLNQFSEDVSMVLWEVSNLPPPLLKRLMLKKEEELHKAEQADLSYRKIKRHEKQVKDIFFRRIIPKNRKTLRSRSHPPKESEKEEEKPPVQKEPDIYTENIFILPAAPEDIPDYVSGEHEIKSIVPELSPSVTLEDLEESESLSKPSEPKFLMQPSTSESTRSSLGLDDETKISKDGFITLIPNNTIELAPIEPRLQPGKTRPTPIKKPSLVVTDMTKRKISLLTNYDKSFSAAETEHDMRENISFVDVVKTTKIKSNLMRWKSIFPTEKEKISKSNLFQMGKTTSPDPYLYSLQQKITHTSKKWFNLKSDALQVSPFIQSCYIPSLPTITESENVNVIPNPLDSIIPMLDSRLRECRMRYYSHHLSHDKKT